MNSMVLTGNTDKTTEKYDGFNWTLDCLLPDIVQVRWVGENHTLTRFLKCSITTTGDHRHCWQQCN